MRTTGLGFLFLFFTFLSSVLMPASVFTASASEAKFSSQDISLLAKQLDAPTISEAQKKTVLEKLRSLGCDEVLALKKLWRAELVAKGSVSQEEAVGFVAIEKIENVFSEKIKEFFGEAATIFNISSSDLASVENALSENQELISAMSSVENTFRSATSTSANAQLAAIASTCYYDNNWSQWLSAVPRSGTTYKGGGVGRVKNDPNEYPCDFVIYIPANTYTKVTGLNSAAQSVVNYDGGLSASPSKDAVIVGYGRVLLYGIPTEDWVRNYILFKK